MKKRFAYTDTLTPKEGISRFAISLPSLATAVNLARKLGFKEVACGTEGGVTSFHDGTVAFYAHYDSFEEMKEKIYQAVDKGQTCRSIRLPCARGAVGRAD